MKCLTLSECSDWLREREIEESPYDWQKPIPTGIHYLQITVPKLLQKQVAEFTRGLFSTMGEFDGALLKLKDWAWDSDYEVDPTAALRLAHGEKRWLIDAPGHLFAAGEVSDVMALTELTLLRSWSAYLYFPSKTATLLLWEGALIDYFCADTGTLQNVRVMALASGSKITHHHAS